MINWIYEHPYKFAFIVLYLCTLCIVIKGIISAPEMDDEGIFISKKDADKIKEQERLYH